MYETLLATTSSEGLQPLGSAAQRSYELVSDTVRSRLSPDHANLFAEPVATEHGDMIDWYAPVAGKAQPIAALDAPTAARLRARLGGLIDDIRRESETLGESGDVQDQRLAEALKNAIEIPSEAMIHAVHQPDGMVQPVLVHWAWLGAERQAVRGILTAMVPRAQPLVAASGPVGMATNEPRGARPWWWLLLLGWLLLAVMLGYILYLLIAPCGLKGGRLVFCPAPGAEAPDIPRVRQGLEAEIAALEHEIVQVDRACQPTIPVVPGAEVPNAPKPAAPKPTPEPAPEPVPQDKTEHDAGAPEGHIIRAAQDTARGWETLASLVSGRDGPGAANSARVGAKAPEWPLNTSVSR
ncbi:hypothetical protein [Microbulbifer sp. S227A]|uniref:hypothetical protein n=1 Tax=Microbulbifer sp. S227A TaxID=3415131 RepID=UPI003C7B1951